MPRYFFHLRTASGELVRDEEGSELAGPSAALDYAIDSAREMIAGDARARGGPIHSRSFEIAEENGTIVRTLFLADVLWR